MIRKSTFAAFCTVCFSQVPTPIEADQSGLVFMYNDLQPFVEATENGVSGFLADYLKRAAKAANVDVVWRSVPWERQLPILKRTPENVCAVALFKTEDRKKFLRYTAAVGTGAGFVLIAPRDHKKLLGHSEFATVINDRTLKPILQTQTVYSSYINNLLASGNITKTKGSMLRMLRSLGIGEYDYLIALKSRAQDLLSRNNLTGDFAIYSHFTDLGKTIDYHVGCSRNTDAALFKRFNSAIKDAGPVETPAR